MGCPYPGLRPFTRDEAYVFFGREAQTDDLLKRLNERRFLAVVGPSGCGKSSLVRAGLIPALETGFMLPAGPRWVFAQMRPGSRPIRRLAEALVSEKAFSPAGLDQAETLGFLHALLLRGPLGLLEALHEAPLPENTNLLILVDQFEEIFRFRREGNADEADAFVSLLLRCTEQRQLPIYIVITMRSDFFGDCALFNGLPEAINRSQYLTPRLTREQRQAAIEGPARVFGGDVAPELVNHLLNEMSNDPDQLPLLQHLLMRMWTWRGGPSMSCDDLLAPMDEAGAVDAVEGAHILTMEDCESVGDLDNALSNHAEEAFATLSETQQIIAQIMFRRLSERGRDNRDVRRPSPAGEIAALAAVGVDEVVQVVDVFRAPGCSFVVPACPEPIYPATVLDITHESFLRQWKRLKGWIDDEAQSVETYRFLEQSARHWQEGRAALWGSPNLDVALAWREKERPTAEWAKRYGGDFAAAMTFLEASEAARREELARKAAKRKAGVRRWRRIAAGSFALMVLMAAGFAYYMYDYIWEHTAYYNAFVKKWGIAEGYGELTDKQRQARLISLKVVREGRSGPVKFMEAVNAAGRCDPRHTIGTVLEFKKADSPSHRECRWEFVRDGRGDVAYELAFNQFDAFVWGLAYTPKTPALGEQRRAYFLDARGQIAPLKNSRAEMIEFTYSPEGYEILHSYFDRDGNPQPGQALAYSQRRSFTPDGIDLELVSLDRDGRPMNDSDGHAYLRMQRDHFGYVNRAEAFDKDGNKVTTTNGWQRFDADYDGAGNVREVRYFNALGGPALCKPCSAHKIVNEYADNGFVKSQSLFGTSNQPIMHEDLKFHKLVNRKFDAQGNVTDQRYYDTDGNRTKENSGCHAIGVKHNKFGQMIEQRCYGLNAEAINNTEEHHLQEIEYDDSGNIIAYNYFGKDESKTLTKYGYHRLVLHRDRRGNIEEQAYFDNFGKPVSAVGKGYHRLIKTYNPLGQPVEWRFYGADGNPIATENGYHREVAAYNQRGHLTEVTYFGINEEPVKHKDGYHRKTIENDEQGNARERAYYDEADHLVALPDGHAVIRKKYDIRGNVTEERYYGPQRQPIPHKSGCTIWRAEYDDQSRPITSECYDRDEKPVRRSDGYARWTRKYDANGNIIEAILYDEKGRLIAPPDSFARLVQAFDERNNEIEEAYYGADGRLLMQPGRGFAIKRRTFAEADGGVVVTVTLLDENERIIARVEIRRDAEGNEVDRRISGPSGEALVEAVFIRRVLPDTTAASLELQPGDRLLSYDGNDVRSVEGMQEMVDARGAAMRTLVIERNGQRISFQVPRGKLGIEMSRRFVPAPSEVTRASPKQSRPQMSR